MRNWLKDIRAIVVPAKTQSAAVLFCFVVLSAVWFAVLFCLFFVLFCLFLGYFELAINF